MHYTLILLLLFFLIGLGALKVYPIKRKVSVYQKQQLANHKLRNAMLQKKVARTLEIEQKHLEDLQALHKKVNQLEREIATQFQARDF